MRRGLALVLTLAAVPACNRDVDVPPRPSAQPLAVVPAFESVAPQQGWTFAATGGVGPYTFAFAQGSPLSGSGASVDPSGVYTAGANGSAQDVLVVTDARGATATALVSVGQKIAITPAFTGTVPGGRISFQATGGDPLSYTFVAGVSPSGGAVAPDGVYAAGAVGDVVDRVLVLDRFGASAGAEVHVGPRLTIYRADTRAVAPHESVTFIALGGQPPYTFGILTKGSGSDARVDATSGVYVAGTRSADPDPFSVTTDVIQVTDSANQPQTATLAVPVGPRLRLLVGVADAHPGETVQLTATGGKPPYVFGFAERTSPLVEPNRDRGGNGGNRSGGTVTAVSGAYVPGSSPGAVDFLQVTDATGAPPDVQEGPPVTGITFAVERGVAQCVAADVNGDLSKDAVLVARSEQGARVVAATFLATQSPVVQTYFLDTRSLPAVFANGQQLRNRESLLVFGGQPVCNGSSGCQQASPDVWALEPDLAGNLAFRQIAGGGTGGPVLVPNDPAFGGPANTHWETQSFNLGVGTFVLDPSAAGTAFLYSDGFDADTLQTTTAFVHPNACPATGPSDRTILRWTWRPGANGPTGRPECLLVTGGGCPACTNARIVAIETGDFNGDGRLDLAFIQTGGNLDYADATLGAKVYVALGSGGTPAAPASFVATGHQDWPPLAASGSWQFEFREQHTQTHFMTVAVPRPLAAGTKDAIVIRMIDPAGNARLFATHDPAAGFTAPFDPTGVGRGSSGVARYAFGGATSAVSYDGGGGEVRAFDVTGAASVVPALAPRAAAATMAFGVSAACFPDANGDGIPDLVAASDLAQTAQLVLGDGTNSAFPSEGQTFGVRAHLRGSEFPIAVGDLDGDGFADVVAASSGAGLDVLWGGGGMLARGARLSTAAVNAVAIGDFGRRTASGAVVPSVLYQDRTGAFGVVHGDGQGGFDPALAVPGVTADGGAVAPVFILATPADLGTTAPGLDLVTTEAGTTGTFAHAMLNQGTRIVDVKSAAVPQGDAQHPIPDNCWTLPVGTGQRTVASLCIYDDVSASNRDRNLARLFVTQVQNPDGGPEGPKPTFSPWLAITDATIAPWRSTTPGARGDVSQVGTLPDGTAVFMLSLDAIYVVELRLVGDPSTPAGWSVQTFAVPGTTANVMIGALGKLDADPATLFHVVEVNQGGMAVLRRDANGYTLVQQLSVMQIPMGIGRLAAGSPGDVVGVIGNFAGSFSGTTEIVPILNLQDGTGRLR